MARMTRIALDLVIISIRTVTPAVSRAWVTTKNAVGSSKYKLLVNNPAVYSLESAVCGFSSLIMERLSEARDSLLPLEQQYLEKQLDMIKKRLANKDRKDAGCHKIKPALGTAWQYAKVEMVPPMTVAIFGGPLGTTIETTCNGFAVAGIKILEGMAKSMDAIAAAKIKAKEAAVKAAEAKRKAQAAAEAKKKEAEDAAKKKVVAAEAKKAEAKKEEAKKTEAKKAETKKAETKKAETKKAPPKKAPPKK